MCNRFHLRSRKQHPVKNEKEKSIRHTLVQKQMGWTQTDRKYSQPSLI